MLWPKLLLKVLSLNGFNKSVMVTVNLCKNVQVAGKIFTKLKETVEKYLPINILPIGTVVYDPHVVEAVRKQKAFISLYPNSNASKCIKNIARHLTRKKSTEDKTDGLETFRTRFMKLLKEPLNMSGVKTRKEHESSGFEEQKNREKRSQESAEKKVHASETVDILLPTKQAGIHGIIEKDHLAQEIHLLLSKLVENTSSRSCRINTTRSWLFISRLLGSTT